MLKQSLLWQRYLVINSLYISLVPILFVFYSRFFRSIFFVIIKRFFCAFFARFFLSAFFCVFLFFFGWFLCLLVVLLLLFKQSIRISWILGPYKHTNRRFIFEFAVKSFNKLRYLFSSPGIAITICEDVAKKKWGVRAGFIARKCYKIYIKKHIFN